MGVISGVNISHRCRRSFSTFKNAFPCSMTDRHRRIEGQFGLAMADERSKMSVDRSFGKQTRYKESGSNENWQYCSQEEILIPIPSNMSLADITADWYRNITADPVWKEEGLAECANASEKRTAAPRSCRGELPLQWSFKGAWCDGVSYDCADRSDEGNCAGKEKKEANTEVGS